jgi:hypothetical protein
MALNHDRWNGFNYGKNKYDKVELNNIEVFERPWLLEIIWRLLAQVTDELCG